MSELWLPEGAVWTGLIGVVVGGVLTLVTGWVVVGRQARLRVQERIVDLRIEAYESVGALGKEMRETAAPPDERRRQLDQRIPRVLESQERFVEWRRRFVEQLGGAQYWLETRALRELYFVQDYLLNLQAILDESPPDEWYEVAEAARQDFIDLASNVGDLVAHWFARRAHKVRYRRPGWHKYRRAVTEQRIQQMNVIRLYGSRLPEVPTV